MAKSTAHLQEEGGARASLRPKVKGQAIKVAETILKKRYSDLAEKAERARSLRAAKRVRVSPRRCMLSLEGATSVRSCARLRVSLQTKKLDLHTNKVKSAQFFVKRSLEKIKDSKRCSWGSLRQSSEQSEASRLFRLDEDVCLVIVFSDKGTNERGPPRLRDNPLREFTASSETTVAVEARRLLQSLRLDSFLLEVENVVQTAEGARKAKASFPSKGTDASSLGFSFCSLFRN